MQAARRGEDSTGTRRRGGSGLGLRGGRGSPGDALHGGGDSKIGADGVAQTRGRGTQRLGQGAVWHCLIAWGGVLGGRQWLEVWFDGEVLSLAGADGVGTRVKLSDRRLGDG
jgi:hypothetical protein